MIMNEKHANKTDGNVKCSRCENFVSQGKKVATTLSNYELPQNLKHATSRT